MLLLKACPKCHGDITEERDHYGCYAHCIQCGYTREVQPRSPISAPTLRQPRPYNTDRKGAQ